MPNLVTRMTALRPAAALAPVTSNPSVWYPMHEGAGTTLADRFGLGPTLTVGGTSPAATIWANAGLLTPNGTDHVATAAAVNSHIDNIFRWSDLWSAGRMIIVGCELQVANASATLQYLMQWARNSGAVGFGGWALGYNGSDQPVLAYRADGSGAAVVTGLGVNIGDTHAAPVTLLFTIYMESATSMRVEVRQSTSASIGSQNIDLTALTFPTNSQDGFTLMAQRTGAAAFAGFLGGGTSGARMNNFFAQKRPVDLALSATAYADMLASRREFPLSLRG